VPRKNAQVPAESRDLRFLRRFFYQKASRSYDLELESV
jgi:hypothetical protein